MNVQDPPTITDSLDRDRLAHRVRRTELVVRELRWSADEHRRRSGGVPPALGRAIESFTDELGSLRRQLAAAP
jgi:hypothetical protein